MIYHVILPDIDVQAVSFNDAIKVIQQDFSERNPEHFGLGVFLKLRSGKPRFVGTHAPTVNLTLHSASTAEAFDALCAQGDYVWRVEQFALAIVPADEPAFVRRLSR